MSEFVLRMSEKDAQDIIRCMRYIANNLLAEGGNVVKAQDEVRIGIIQEGKEKGISSMEVAKMFGCAHIKVFNMITKYVSIEAGEEEKKEFRFEKRAYRMNREHEICFLTEKGCRLFLDKICSKEYKASKQFVAGTEKLKKVIEERFQERVTPDGNFLMDGRSRAECWKIKELFDRFITGPGLEKREIAELTDKYQQFHDVMKATQLRAKESNEIESAVYGVAIESEMQGFIYGFKLYEELLNRQLAVAM